MESVNRRTIIPFSFALAFSTGIAFTLAFTFIPFVVGLILTSSSVSGFISSFALRSVRRGRTLVSYMTSLATLPANLIREHMRSTKGNTDRLQSFCNINCINSFQGSMLAHQVCLPVQQTKNLRPLLAVVRVQRVIQYYTVDVEDLILFDFRKFYTGAPVLEESSGPTSLTLLPTRLRGLRLLLVLLLAARLIVGCILGARRSW